MNDLQVFESPEFGAVRTISRSGEPWFVAADVCRALDIQNSRDAIARLDEDEKGVGSTDTLGGRQEMAIINEPGLYALVLGSRKPEAKAFKRWVTHEVIPSIRRTGGYIAGQEEMSPEELLARALVVAQQTLAQREAQVKGLQADNARLQVDVQIAQPKAEYFDMLVDRHLLTSFRDTAKQLQVREKTLIGWLLSAGYIYRDQKGKLMPYAGKGDGLFEVKESVNTKTQWAGVQTLVTPKGRETFRLLWCTD